jgi:hypothetical protein
LALQEIEVRAAEAEQRRLDAEASEAERRRAHEIARNRARGQYREAKRAEHLLAQVQLWDHAVEIRAFITLVRATAGARGYVIDDEWLDWAERYADIIDPTNRPVLEPDVAEPTFADLQPFLTT